MFKFFRALALTLSAGLFCGQAQAPAGMPVTITAYTATSAETDSTPTISACGRNVPNQIALSRDLFRSRYQCGDIVRVWRPDTKRWHRYVVWDTMSPRFTRRVDIAMPSRSQALAFGRRRGVLAPE